MQSTFLREIKVSYKTTKWKIFKLGDPSEVAMFLQETIGKELIENFIALYLDNQNNVSGWYTISIGTLNEALVHPREVFRNAILANAASIIVAHNHPSLKLTPSKQDIDTTNRLKNVGELLGILLLDHIIVNGQAYLSLKESGYL